MNAVHELSKIETNELCKEEKAARKDLTDCEEWNTAVEKYEKEVYEDIDFAFG